MSDVSVTNISNYTNKERFANLIRSINSDITSYSAYNMQVNNTVLALSGKPIAARTPITGIAPLDAIANKVGDAKGAFSGLEDSLAAKAGLALTDGKPQVINLSAQGPINTANINAKMVIDYLPPTNIAMSSFDKLGKELDEMIKDSLIVQTFHLKGTDILCTTLCMLMSLLPCQLTNKIVDDIQRIKDLQSSINSGMRQAVGSEAFALSSINDGFSGGISGLANIKDVTKSLNIAFKKNQSLSASQQISQEIKSVVATFSTVVQVLNLLISATKLGYQDPQAILGFLVNGMFDLLDNVLLALQALAVQMADKIMNKVIAPIEKYFKSNTFPAMCGIGAQLLFRKILAVIYNFKNKILAFIADLFSFQKSARKKFTLFNKNMLWTLELSALLRVLELLLNNFLDIVIACGVVKRPCKEDGTGPNLSQNYNNESTFSEDGVTFSNPLAQTVFSLPPEPGTLNEIAMKLQPMINSIFPGSNNQVTSGQVQTSMNDLPTLITYLLGEIDLGPNLNLYIHDNNATVVYNNKMLCGAN